MVGSDWSFVLSIIRSRNVYVLFNIQSKHSATYNIHGRLTIIKQLSKVIRGFKSHLVLGKPRIIEPVTEAQHTNMNYVTIGL